MFLRWGKPPKLINLHIAEAGETKGIEECRIKWLSFKPEYLWKSVLIWNKAHLRCLCLQIMLALIYVQEESRYLKNLLQPLVSFGKAWNVPLNKYQEGVEAKSSYLHSVGLLALDLLQDMLQFLRKWIVQVRQGCLSEGKKVQSHL